MYATHHFGSFRELEVGAKRRPKKTTTTTASLLRSCKKNCWLNIHGDEILCFFANFWYFYHYIIGDEDLPSFMFHSDQVLDLLLRYISITRQDNVVTGHWAQDKASMPGLPKKRNPRNPLTYYEIHLYIAKTNKRNPRHLPTVTKPTRPSLMVIRAYCLHAVLAVLLHE